MNQISFELITSWLLLRGYHLEAKTTVFGLLTFTFSPFSLSNFPTTSQANIMLVGTYVPVQSGR
jgi:hypothetical protein